VHCGATSDPQLVWPIRYLQELHALELIRSLKTSLKLNYSALKATLIDLHLQNLIGEVVFVITATEHYHNVFINLRVATNLVM
jgi:hypothetical protein